MRKAFLLAPSVVLLAIAWAGCGSDMTAKTWEGGDASVSGGSAGSAGKSGSAGHDASTGGTAGSDAAAGSAGQAGSSGQPGNGGSSGEEGAGGTGAGGTGAGGSGQGGSGEDAAAGCPSVEPQKNDACDSNAPVCCYGTGPALPWRCVPESTDAGAAWHWVQLVSKVCCPAELPVAGEPCNSPGDLTCCYQGIGVDCDQQPEPDVWKSSSACSDDG